MRVALVVPGFSQHEADWAIPVLQHLATALAREHQIEVFSLRYPAAGQYQFSGLTQTAIGGGQRFGLDSIPIWWQTVKAIRERHRRNPFDIIHAFWADEPGLTAVLAGRWLNRPVVLSLGGGELTFLPDIGYGTQGSVVRRAIVRLALSGAAIVTAGSQYQCNLAETHGVSHEKLRKVSLGVTLNQFAPGTTPDWHRPTLLQAASLSPVKNQTLLLTILKEVQRHITEINLVVAGDGPLANLLQKQTNEMGLTQAVTWQPALSHPQMPAFYHQGHIYVQSSRHESQGVAVVEALTSGLPVIGTPVGLMAEVAARPASFSAQVVANQIVELFADRENYERLRQASQQLVEDKFSLSQTVATFELLYQTTKTQ